MVPRFLQALADAGATAHRVPAYMTMLGAPPGSCDAEKLLLQAGHIHAIAMSSTAEVRKHTHSSTDEKQIFAGMLSD